MPNSFIVIAIVILFYLLGKAADLITASVREASGSYGARVFISGILLGLITSLPEFVVAINAFIDGVPLLSIGNLLGGTVVLFSLFSSIKSINVNLNTSYYLLMLTMLILFATIMLFRKQGKCLSRYHGAVLILLYAVFFASQAAMLVRG